MTRGLLALLLTAAMVGSATAQSPIRRVQPKAFPLSATVNAGLGFGGARATYYDSTVAGCTPGQCVTAGAGSGWAAGLDLQAPLGSTVGVAVGGQIGRPTQRLCVRSQCQSRGGIWAIRGNAMLLWRFKARAPIYFGLGGAVTYFTPAPVVNQNRTADGQGTTLEIGGTVVVGYDFRLTERLGGRVAWSSFLMAPSSEGLPVGYAVRSLAWDNTFTFGVRFPFGT